MLSGQTRVLSAAVAACVLLSGCSTVSSTVQATPSYTVTSDTPPVCGGMLVTDCWNSYVYEQLTTIDMEYDAYKRDLFFATSGGSLLADIGILGTNLAGSLVPTAATKATLAAISAGISGTRTSIDADVLYNSSLVGLVAQMDANRAKIKANIVAVLTSGGYKYFGQARGDLVSYQNAGEIQNALLAGVNASGAQAQQCQDAIDKMTAGRGSASC